MTDSGAGRSGHCRAKRIAGLAAVALLLAAVPLQVAFLAPVAHRQLMARHEHRIRELFVAAADRIPHGARYAVTSAARTPNAVYFLGPAVNLEFAGPAAVVRRRLETHRVRYVIVLNRSRPAAFTAGNASWYRVILSLRAGDVVELLP
jgi:hypothetical protein